MDSKLAQIFTKTLSKNQPTGFPNFDMVLKCHQNISDKNEKNLIFGYEKIYLDQISKIL